MPSPVGGGAVGFDLRSSGGDLQSAEPVVRLLISRMPPEMAMAHLNLSEAVLNGIPREKQPIIDNR